MASNNRTLLVELDFDEIKNNLITYFKNQTQFSGFDFTGAGINQLMNLLAYNTHYNGLMVNMLSNEIFPVTAQLRDNIVVGAKNLGYIPRSMGAAKAFVNVIVTPTSNTVATLLLPKFSPFISSAIDGTNYPFVTSAAHTAPLSAGIYTYNNIELIEGVPLNFTYVVNTTNNPRNVYNIPSANIDTSTLLVNVLEATPSPAQTWPYTINSDVTQLDGNSRVFFLEAATSNTYNIYFGDGVIGRALNTGDIVNLSFISTDGEITNFANSFAIETTVGGFGNVIVQAVSAASGGAQAETDENIRRNAPIFYTTQNRAVTEDDYKNILLRNYPNIGSVSVWGGNKNNPPVYGQVFISIKPKVGNYLTNLQKQAIIDTILSEQSIVTVTPIILDADFTYINLELEVYYNPKLTTSSQDTLTNLVRNVALGYNTTQLGAFESIFQQTILEQSIINSDRSFLSVDSDIILQKRFFPTLGENKNYTLNFYTSLVRGGQAQKLYNIPSFSLFNSFGVEQQCYLDENINTYTGISSISVVNPGFNYTSATVTIDGDGTGAIAHPIVINGRISQVVLDDPGQGYSIATATVNGDGIGAIISPVLGVTAGDVETYYFTNSNKFFITQKQGSLDHINGTVILSNFAPLDIANDTKQLSIYAFPEKSVLVPIRNNIYLIDPTDPNSIKVTLTPQIF